jgi:hypothetical protein
VLVSDRVTVVVAVVVRIAVGPLALVLEPEPAGFDAEPHAAASSMTPTRNDPWSNRIRSSFA